MIQIKLVGTDGVEVEDVQLEEGKTAHILIPAYPNNEYADIRPAALVTLSPKDAQDLLKRMEGAVKLAKELDDENRFDEVVYFDYTPTWLDRSALVDFGGKELEILAESLDENEDVALLTEDQAAQGEACAEVRVEISRLHISCGLAGQAGTIYWTMRPKYSDYIVDTDMISEDTLRRIAGRQ
jgi:hypothetical protein